MLCPKSTWLMARKLHWRQIRELCLALFIIRLMITIWRIFWLKNMEWLWHDLVSVCAVSGGGSFILARKISHPSMTLSRVSGYFYREWLKIWSFKLNASNFLLYRNFSERYCHVPATFWLACFRNKTWTSLKLQILSCLWSITVLQYIPSQKVALSLLK